MNDRPPEYDAEVTVCGEVYFFRRSMALLRRLEQRFGPLPTLFRALQQADVTQTTIVGIYEEMIRGVDDNPGLARIGAWVWDEGHYRCATALAKVVGEMTVGAAQLRSYEDKRLAEAEEAGTNPTRPASMREPASAVASTSAA